MFKACDTLYGSQYPEVVDVNVIPVELCRGRKADSGQPGKGWGKGQLMWYTEARFHSSGVNPYCP